MTRPPAGARPRRRDGRPGRGVAAVGARRRERFIRITVLEAGSARRQGRLAPRRQRPHRGARAARLARPLRQRLPTHAPVLRGAGPRPAPTRLPDPRWRDAFMPAGQLGLFDTGPRGLAPMGGDLLRPTDQLPGDADIDSRAPSVAELLVRSTVLVRDFYAVARARADCGPVPVCGTRPGRRRRRRPPRSVVPTRPGRQPSSSSLLAGRRRRARRARRRGGDRRRVRAAARPAAAGGPHHAGAASAPRPRRPRTHRASSAWPLTDSRRPARPTTPSTTSTSGTGSRRHGAHHVDAGAPPSCEGSTTWCSPTRTAIPPARGSQPGWGAFLSAKLWFDYKGAIFWKMSGRHGRCRVRAAVPSTVARGVDVRFCPTVRGAGAVGRRHRDHRSVVIAPANSLAPDAGRYQPLVTRRGASLLTSRRTAALTAIGARPCAAS